MARETRKAQASLVSLPPELLTQIVAHVDTVRAVLRLALTCKMAHAFVENDGFRVFVQTRRNSLGSVDSDFSDSILIRS